MGTRHLISAHIDGEYKLAQYGQWDGYPSGQGLSVLKFLKSADLESFKRNLKTCSYITDDEWNKLWEDIGVDVSKEKYVSTEVAERFYSRNPQFNRDMGADILNYITQSSSSIKLRNSIDFVKDSLFCEWAYVIDFDKGTLEVFQGFNQSPLDSTERFYTEEVPKKSVGGETYYPVKLCATFELVNLPTKEDFLNTCEPLEEEEENVQKTTTEATDNVEDVQEDSFLKVLAEQGV